MEEPSDQSKSAQSSSQVEGKAMTEKEVKLDNMNERMKPNLNVPGTADAKFRIPRKRDSPSESSMSFINKTVPAEGESIKSLVKTIHSGMTVMDVDRGEGSSQTPSTYKRFVTRFSNMHVRILSY